MHPGTMVQYQLSEAHILAWRERDVGADGDDPAAGTNLQVYDDVPAGGEEDVGEEAPVLTIERG